jgi:hypothetical protein
MKSHIHTLNDDLFLCQRTHTHTNNGIMVIIKVNSVYIYFFYAGGNPPLAITSSIFNLISSG